MTSDRILNEIGQAIRELRERDGQTLEELSIRVGLSKSRLSNIEEGRVFATAEEILFLAREFNVSASAFLGEVEAEDARAVLEARTLKRRTEAAPKVQEAPVVTMLSRIR